MPICRRSWRWYNHLTQLCRNTIMRTLFPLIKTNDTHAKGQVLSQVCKADLHVRSSLWRALWTTMPSPMESASRRPGICWTITKASANTQGRSRAGMALQIISTMETGKCSKSEFLIPDLIPESVIDHLPAHKWSIESFLWDAKSIILAF